MDSPGIMYALNSSKEQKTGRGKASYVAADLGPEG